MYIDLLQIQRSSFLKFLQNGINQVFDNINPIIIANRKYIFFSKYYLLKIPSQIHFVSLDNPQPSHVSFYRRSRPARASSRSNPTGAQKPFQGPRCTAVTTNFESGIIPINNCQYAFALPKGFLPHTTQWVQPPNIPLNCAFTRLTFRLLQNGQSRQKPRSGSEEKVPLSPLSTKLSTLGLFPFLLAYRSMSSFGLSEYVKSFKRNPHQHNQACKQGKREKPRFFGPKKARGYRTWTRRKRVAHNPFTAVPTHGLSHNDVRLRDKKHKALSLSSVNLQNTSHLTYSSEFYIPVQIIDQISKKMYLRWLLLADLPIQTKRGHFIINGYPKTVIHQIVRSPGIRFKNEDDQILADIISMRGAWMGIQIQYEKNLKAATFDTKRERVLRLQTLDASRGTVGTLLANAHNLAPLGYASNPDDRSEKIHEALSLNFFISPSRSDKGEKKKIKLSGFAFLNYLFDHPYFVYNNYIPSLQRSQYFYPFSPTTSREPREGGTRGTRTVPVARMLLTTTTRLPGTSRELLQSTNQVASRLPFFFKSLLAKENYPPYFTSRSLAGSNPLKTLTMRLGTIPRGGHSSFPFLTNPVGSPHETRAASPPVAREQEAPCNRLLGSLVSFLNTTNFRDVTFERFMNAKFYDIGLMGRKRLNKKLRLNVPFGCTTLTPLDFLAIFYKLFSLYNNFNLIHFPMDVPRIGEGFKSKANPWSRSKSNFLKTSGTIAFRESQKKLLPGEPIASPGASNSLKPRNDLLDRTLKQTGSLDHLNARHIRTCGEFLFLQFWRAVLRFYQVLSQLSGRSNFIRSSPSATGKTGRNFFSVAEIRFEPWFPRASAEQRESPEYIVPTSNSQTHILKAWGVKEPTSGYNGITSLRLLGGALGEGGEPFLSGWQSLQNTMSVESLLASGTTNAGRMETLGIAINRNDLDSILPYTPLLDGVRAWKEPKTYLTLRGSRPAGPPGSHVTTESSASLHRTPGSKPTRGKVSAENAFSGRIRVRRARLDDRVRKPGRVCEETFRSFGKAKNNEVRDVTVEGGPSLGPSVGSLPQFIKKLLYETKELRIFDAKERVRNLETKLFNGVFKEFFNLDPLSQDLDETNGLSEIIHKRRISALGKGGVTSKNAPLSIRSIHPSFYGRLCPIDSPEGDRVGLINSLTNYARINNFGYIATPFYRTRHNDIQQECDYRLSLDSSLSESGEKKSATAHWAIPTVQMRICPPVAFFGKISNPTVPSLRWVVSGFKEETVDKKQGRLVKRTTFSSGFESGFIPINKTPLGLYPSGYRRGLKLYPEGLPGERNPAPTTKAWCLRVCRNRDITANVEVLRFYDTHYMTPPITHRENRINNPKDKNKGHVDTPFLTCYFDFISFQGYAPITAFQFFSPGVGLIPFLEHDDGTRALMGANMQRQAVPLILPSRPIVGTGLEKNIAASFIISSHNSGYLYYISGKQSKQIFIRRPGSTSPEGVQRRGTPGFTARSLQKRPFLLKQDPPSGGPACFSSRGRAWGNRRARGSAFILNTHWLPYRKSYKATCINKKPAILENSWVQKGDLLVDGTSSVNGELSLGQNLFSIYMPWEGYNFEDAILISDRAASAYTTIHVEEFSVKISKNEFVSSIIKPFTWVNQGDVLVSKKRKLENEFIMNRLLFGMSSKGSGVVMKPGTSDPTQPKMVREELYPKVQGGPAATDTSIKPLYNPSLFFSSNSSKTSLGGNQGFLVPLVSKESKTFGKRGLSNSHSSKLHLLLPRLSFSSVLTASLPSKGSVGRSVDASSNELNHQMPEARRFQQRFEKISTDSESYKLKTSFHGLWLAQNWTETLDQNIRTLRFLSAQRGSPIQPPTRKRSVRSQYYQLALAKSVKVGSFANLEKTSSKNLTRGTRAPVFAGAPKNGVAEAGRKKNDNFEIDTSYRTGESICGWIISVKSTSTSTQPAQEESVNGVSRPYKGSLAKAKFNNVLSTGTSEKAYKQRGDGENVNCKASRFYTKLEHGDLYSKTKLHAQLADGQVVAETSAATLNQGIKKHSKKGQTRPLLVLRPSERTNTKNPGDQILIYIAVAKPLQVGDKMSGRHGNKGIISKILPFYDMPYLIDGTPIDIVLNPLGVPSRMNVGQIYESLLGLAGFYKQEYYRIPPFDENYSSQFSRNFVYWKLNQLKVLHFFATLPPSLASQQSHSGSGRMPTVYSWQNYSLQGYSWTEQIKREVTNPRTKTSSSWFQRTDQIRSTLGKQRERRVKVRWWILPNPRALLWAKKPPVPSLPQGRLLGEKIGLNPYFPGKMRLLNGHTGETFYRPIIVGKSYMLKLIHLVHHKIHARATGPYALITQQPLKGKRNQGGQRMGEMEIWALYGFGSASILYEMLTIKSDDPVGRERILREIAGLKGGSAPTGGSARSLQEYAPLFHNGLSSNNDPLEKGISESFRVLVMNLRALCLDMQVFKDASNLS